MPDRLAIFLDFQNVHLVGHGLYGRGRRNYQCVPEPSLVADLITARRGSPGRAELVGVYRGRPDHNFEPVPASANDRQAARWSRDSRVRMERRQLAYRGWPKVPPVEKGIDVKLAVDLIHAAMSQRYDALVLFSSDTDLIPAIELAAEIGAMVEVACWDGAKPLRIPRTGGPRCHYLTQSEWRSVIRDWSGRA